MSGLNGNGQVAPQGGDGNIPSAPSQPTTLSTQSAPNGFQPDLFQQAAQEYANRAPQPSSPPAGSHTTTPPAQPSQQPAYPAGQPGQVAAPQGHRGDPTPALPSQAGPQTAGSVLRDYLKGRNYPVDDVSDDDLLGVFEHTLPLARNREQIERMAQLGSQVAPYYGQFQEWMRQQHAAQQQQQAPPAAPEKPKLWDPPEFDEEWKRFLKKDPETGLWEALRPELTSLAQKANDHDQYVQRRFNEFRKDPYKFYEPYINDRLEEYGKTLQQQIFDQLASQQQQATQQQHAAAFLQQYVREFFAHDDKGQLITDPSTGAPKRTWAGEVFNYYANEARQLGIGQLAAVQHYAWNQTQAYMAAQGQPIGQASQTQTTGGASPQGHQPPNGRAGEGTPAPSAAASAQPATQPQRSPEERNRDTKGRFLSNALQERGVGGAGHAPNRDATVASAARQEIAQNRELDFTQMALQEHRDRGHLV